MPIDPYASCPGGTGKKVKFCCPDLLGELDTIQRMLEGDQRQGCLDHISSLDQKFPGRACLLTTKAYLQSELGQVDAARETVAGVLQAQPDNPVALAEEALLAADREGAKAGILPLQRALAACGNKISAKVYEAIGGIAQLLLVDGEILAARGHLHLQLRINAEDETAVALLMRLNASPGVPLLFKEEPRFIPCPAGVPWQKKFEEALQPALGSGWLEGAAKLAALAQEVPQSPAIWHNLAILQSWLAERADAAESLRSLSALDVPLEDAVEAEALAQLLDPNAKSDLTEELRITYTLTSAETALERLAADRRAVRLPLEGIEPEEGLPPPRGGYWLLDRELPATGEGITINAIPNIIGRVLVFGRETDREPRLELQLYRDNVLPVAQVQATLASILGNTLGSASQEETLGYVPSSELVLGWNWRLPEDVRPEQVRKLVNEQRREVILNRWPSTSQQLLGNKTPAEAAKDPALRIKVLAAILLVELSVEEAATGKLVNELRKQLGLPESGPIDPKAVDIGTLPLARLNRLEVSKLADDDLNVAQQRAMMGHVRIALRKLTAEVVARPSLDGLVDKAASYSLLASLEDDSDRKLEYLAKARAIVEQQGQSCARLDLTEFTLRLQRGEGEQAQRILQHIQTKHGNEPGVRQALMQLMMELGIIGPDGRMRGPAPQAAESESGLIIPGGASGEKGKLWTPDGDTGGGKKSALWTPGME